MGNANATNQRLQCYSITSLDGKLIGSTEIFVPNSTFTPVAVTFQATTVSGLISASSASIGTNASSYNNILPISAMLGLSAVNTGLTLNLSGIVSVVQAGTPVVINITTIAVATTYMLKVTVIGFYD